MLISGFSQVILFVYKVDSLLNSKLFSEAKLFLYFLFLFFLDLPQHWVLD